MDQDDENGIGESESNDCPNLLDIEAIAECFRPGGAVDRALDDAYEFREQQSLAACEVASAFNEEAICLLEAPPGTGKTLAYLLPAARWALTNSEQVIVSTKTINLQSQLIEKDLPLVRRMLGDDLRFSLIKGRGNYICPRRVQEVRRELAQGELFDGHAQADLAKLLKWAGTTEDGSRADLAFNLSKEVWEHVSADNAGCSRAQCQSSECFFFNARKRIADAHLLVVNHAFLFSHLKYGDDVGLLPMNRVVLDEAHNVVDVATDCFSVHLSNHDFQKAIRRLNGVATHVATLAVKLGGQEAEVLRNVQQILIPAEIGKLEEAATWFFNLMFDLMHADGADSRERRLTADEERRMEQSEECANFVGQMETVLECVSRCRKAVSDQNAVGEDLQVAGVEAELAMAERLLKEQLEAADRFAEPDARDRLIKSMSVERKTKERFIELSVAPLHIEPHLQDTLYEPCKTVIMTSATLRVDNRFDFQKRTLGLEDRERCRERAMSSPFDHTTQALFAVVTDLPEPPAWESGDQHDEYVTGLAEAVFASVMAAGGGALVLFTARDMLQTISGRLSPRLQARGLTSLTQYAQSRERILEAFRSDTNSVLFATDSFREGVDIVGDALRLVVITKLPFRVPTDPVFKARSEAVGTQAFHKYGVPLAVIDFRQAFGRLIRSKTDSGAVVVLDGRLVGKSYGRRFQASVPPCRTVHTSLEEVNRAVGDFFRRRT